MFYDSRFMFQEVGFTLHVSSFTLFMLEIIVIVILISSIFGIGIIIYRKIPVLKKLPESTEKSLLKDDFLLKIKKIIKSLALEIYLQKILSKIRILSLKIDNKTFNWLQKLREKSQKEKVGEKDMPE